MEFCHLLFGKIDQITDLYNTSVVHEIKNKIVRWIGHVSRLCEEWMTNKIIP